MAGLALDGLVFEELGLAEWPYTGAPFPRLPFNGLS
jgi:hypothetical protein